MLFPATLRLTGLHDQLTRSVEVWRIAFLVAIAGASLMAMQDLLFGGAGDAPLRIAAAQYLLPWLGWAILAPLLLLFFDAYPIDLERPWPALLIHGFAGIAAVGVKLLISAPLAALFIWGPLDVRWGDGLGWLLQHRGGANLLMFWALLSGYTAFRYSRRRPEQPPASAASAPIERIPVRAGSAMRFVPLAEVMLIEAEHNQTVVFAGTDRHIARATLQDFEKRLPAGQFVRVHRSRIINVEHITRIEPWGRGDYLIVLRNGAQVVSGKTYRYAIKQLLDIRQV
ncbi:MAG TPA: LytTR family DNA-binding domain-containing protein [Longimicrobiales bacterium]|nr:LytTR family DNA-binding domain-containing protein [Longimicrobiales bacterium]